MPPCLLCGAPATRALHALSGDMPDGGHYTELVFVCDACLSNRTGIVAALPPVVVNDTPLPWILDSATLAVPLVACPACGRQTHPDRLWTCTACGQAGCAACMAPVPGTTACAECYGAQIDRPARQAARALGKNELHAWWEKSGVIARLTAEDPDGEVPDRPHEAQLRAYHASEARRAMHDAFMATHREG